MTEKERKRGTHFQPVAELTCIITKCIYRQNWLNIGSMGIEVSTRFRSLQKQLLYKCFKCIAQGHLFWFLNLVDTNDSLSKVFRLQQPLCGIYASIVSHALPRHRMYNNEVPWQLPSGSFHMEQ